MLRGKGFRVFGLQVKPKPLGLKDLGFSVEVLFRV